MLHWMYFKTKAPSAVLEGEEQTLWCSHCGLLILLHYLVVKSMLEFVLQETCKWEDEKACQGKWFPDGKRDMKRNNGREGCAKQRQSLGTGEGHRTLPGAVLAVEMSCASLSCGWWIPQSPRASRKHKHLGQEGQKHEKKILGMPCTRFKGF